MTNILKYIIFITVISVIVFIGLRFAEKFTFLGNLFGDRQAETVRVEDTQEYKAIEDSLKKRDARINELERKGIIDSMKYDALERSKSNVSQRFRNEKKRYDESTEAEKDKLFWERYYREYGQ